VGHTSLAVNTHGILRFFTVALVTNYPAINKEIKAKGIQILPKNG